MSKKSLSQVDRRTDPQKSLVVPAKTEASSNAKLLSGITNARKEKRRGSRAAELAIVEALPNLLGDLDFSANQENGRYDARADRMVNQLPTDTGSSDAPRMVKRMTARSSLTENARSTSETAPVGSIMASSQAEVHTNFEPKADANKAALSQAYSLANGTRILPRPVDNGAIASNLVRAHLDRLSLENDHAPKSSRCGADTLALEQKCLVELVRVANRFVDVHRDDLRAVSEVEFLNQVARSLHTCLVSVATAEHEAFFETVRRQIAESGPSSR